MLKPEKCQMWLLGQVLASLLFYFTTTCPSTGAAQGWRHPPPRGLDCVQGPVFHEACSLR